MDPQLNVSPPQCSNHPDRPAREICSSCLKGICAECRRTLHGAWFCPVCYSEELKTVPKPPSKSWLEIVILVLVGLAVAAILGLAVLFGLLYMICGRR